MLSEDDLVAAVAAVAGGGGAGVTVGIGDDAAVLAGGIVASTDILVDGVHFDSGRLGARDIGHRAAAASLSDMAAMGAEPVCLLAAFGLPEGFEDVRELAAGMHEHGVPLSGGDLSRSAQLLVSVTAIGRAERPVLRSGGRPGDVLVVTGTLGGQAAGGYTARVTPRLAEGRSLAAVATAMLDLSDGIATDARRLAAASGTGAVVELERLPRAPGATVEQAAAGGEDYELLAAVPEGAELPVPVTAVGRLTGDGEVRLLDAGGRPRSLRGWDHFA
jgi:thiamine-monophosphate kinase